MKKIYTVATAHLDTVWSWDFEETVREYIPRTLTENFALFEKYPNYTFSFEGSYRYELMEEYYPELFEKLKEYIKQGRWHVCGSAFENGDVNVPSPEALIRNILYGNSYFEEKFGKRSCDIFLPDCFGFGWALPSIMNHCNLKGFTTQKLSWGSAYGVPFDIGRWKGVDGKEVLASVNCHQYTYAFSKIRTWKFLLDKLRENEKYGLNSTFVFHGVGDRGGAPIKSSVAVLEKEMKKNAKEEIEVLSAAADDIYRDIEREFTPQQKAQLPEWNNELVMTNHGAGGYTSRAVGKRWNRRNEELADLAERAGVIAAHFGTADYNTKAMDKAWKRVIAHHFHDDIPGTSCQRVYKRSWNDLAVSMNQFANELESSISAASSLLDTSFCKGTPVTVYNPVEQKRSGAVSVRFDSIKTPYLRVYDESGKEIQSQTKTLADGSTELVFLAQVPSLGFKVYDVRAARTPCKAKSALSIDGNRMENEKYTVTLNDNGDIASVYDKELGFEVLREPITLGLFEYTGSRVWPAWEMNYKQANKDEDRIPQKVKCEIYENGAARVAFKVTQKDDRSTFSNIIALTSGGKVVEVYSEIEWQSLCTMAKNKFAFTCSNEKATFDLGLGAIRRGKMTEKLFEVPAQKWADITDKNGKRGVSVISECKYGWDKFSGSTLRLTVLHTPKYNYRIDSVQSMMDLGLNRYSYALFSHEGAVGEETQTLAREFVTPMTAYICLKHPGTLGSEYSFGEISDSAIIIRAMKKAQNSDEIIVRLAEGANKRCEKFSLKLADGIASAREVYASEEEKGEAVVKGGKLITSFAPYEIKSFALKLKPMKKKAQKVYAKLLPLPFDRCMVTRQNRDGDFEYTLPFEITPESFCACSVNWKINKNGKNAMLADGQVVPLSGNANTFVLLCASLAGDKNCDFTAGGKKYTVCVPDAFERFARWDLYDFGETARIKKGKIAYESTHCHKDGKDEIAKSVYLYAVEIPLDGAESVTLPKDEDIVILGAAEKMNYACLGAPVYDEVEERPFTFEKTTAEKIRYIHAKADWNLTDVFHRKDNNRGKDY